MRIPSGTSETRVLWLESSRTDSGAAVKIFKEWNGKRSHLQQSSESRFVSDYWLREAEGKAKLPKLLLGRMTASMGDKETSTTECVGSAGGPTGFERLPSERRALQFLVPCQSRSICRASTAYRTGKRIAARASWHC